MKTKFKLFAICHLLSGLCLSARAQGTAFTYQGRLNDGANPASGTYDLRFAIYDSLTAGIQQGSLLTNSATSVSNGLFTATVDFGNQFPGTPRWLEISVRTNGNGIFSTLSPRQLLTPAPYAIFAGMVSPNGLAAGTYANAVTLNNAGNSFSGNGAGLTNVNANVLGGFGAANFWNLGGNAGTTPGTQFLGTLDNLPVEFKVNGTRALRLEPNPNAPNVIGGSIANVVTNGNYGAVIAGGGSAAYPNRVGAIFGTVVGGAGNAASGNFATAMGQFNTASGYAGTAMGYSTVAAGFGSQAGGTTAKANHDGTFVWADNTFVDFTSTAANQFLIRAAGGVGINNNNPNGAALAVNGNVTVSGSVGTPGNQPLELKANNQRGLRLEPTALSDTVNVIGGSAVNFVGAGVVGATIGGGGSDFWSFTNRVEADFGTVSGGGQNTIAGWYATIGGGGQNTIQTDGILATISGGFSNMVQTSGWYAAIGGGYQNTIQNNAAYGTIAGGLGNTIQPNTGWATIPGGRANSATTYAFAAGHRAKANHTGAFVWADSTDADFASTADNQFLIRAGGGVGIGTTAPLAQLAVNGNTRIDAQGGNYAEGLVLNCPPDMGGYGGLIFHSATRGGALDGTTVKWDVSYNYSPEAGIGTGGLSFIQNNANTRLYLAANGNVGIGTTSPSQKLNVIGNILASGTVTGSSDRNVKEHFSSVNPRNVLEKVSALPITEWNYIADGATQRHIGPMAQDFYSAFNVGLDDKHISMVDADGVALAAIQGLNQKLEEQRAENAELKQRLDALEKIIRNEKSN